MITTIEDITVFNDIREKLKLVTAEHMRLVEEQLDPPNDSEVVEGTVAVPTRALWALARIYHAEHLLESARATGLIEKELVREHLQKAMIASEFEDLIDELMWTQARTDTGYWEQKAVGIRSGWRLVSFERKEHPLMEMLKLGPFPLTPPRE